VGTSTAKSTVFVHRLWMMPDSKVRVLGQAMPLRPDLVALAPLGALGQAMPLRPDLVALAPLGALGQAMPLRPDLVALAPLGARPLRLGDV